MAIPRIVIAGGGVAALEGALALSALAGERVDATLVSPKSEFAYRAHQVREPFGVEPGLSLPITDILAGTSVSYRHDAVVAVHPEDRELTTSSGDVLAYDGLLIAVGGTPFPAFAHGVTFDRPNDPEPFDELLSDVAQGFVQNVAVVVPEAQGWALPAYDIALILRAWARRRGLEPGITLVTPERMPLEMFGDVASAKVGEVMERAQVRTACGAGPVVFSDTALLAGPHWITADRIVSLPRLAGPRIPGLPCDWSGFIRVDERGAVPGHAGVFAAGDGAGHATKQGGLAAQQADIAAREIMTGLGLRVARPQAPPMVRGVLATPDGPLFLQARHVTGSGPRDSSASFTPLWDPPTKVVTRWLGNHLDGLVTRRTSAFAA